MCDIYHHTFKERPISELLTSITSPIAGDNPFGENINYDTDFDTIKNEIAKLSGIDFDVVEETGIKILKQKSKDIRIFAFLSYAFLRNDKWEFLCDLWDGLGILAEQNYDALFPDRDRARQNAFKWLAEDRFTTLLQEKKPTEGEYDHLTRLVAGLTKLKPILEQKFPEGSPFPSALFSRAQIWEKSCTPKPKEEPPPPPPPPKAPAGEGADSQAATQPNADASAPKAAAAASAEPMDTPKQAQGIVRKAALFLIENEMAKPMGYRLLRSVRWDILDKAPPSEGGKTQLQGPNPQQRAYFQKLAGDKEWKTVVEKAEAAFVSGASHFWLDLQRLVATACKELGAEYTAVRKAVLFETALLLQRIPDLTALAFSDGSPFCDDATKDWIASEVDGAFGSGEGASAGGGRSSDPLAEERQTVNQLVSAGKIEEALAELQKSMRGSSNERDNFGRTVLVGTLLLKAKQPDVAVSVLESLEQKIENHGLDRWDPDLAVEAWAALVAAYKVARAQKAQNVQVIMQDKLNTILSKISQIDPRRAFTLSK